MDDPKPKPERTKLPNGGEYDPERFDEGPAAGKRTSDALGKLFKVPRGTLVKREAAYQRKRVVVAQAAKKRS